MRCLYVLISSVVAVAGCMLSGTGTLSGTSTGTATVMLLSVGDISSRVILSIISAFKTGLFFLDVLFAGYCACHHWLLTLSDSKFFPIETCPIDKVVVGGCVVSLVPVAVSIDCTW